VKRILALFLLLYSAHVNAGTHINVYLTGYRSDGLSPLLAWRSNEHTGDKYFTDGMYRCAVGEKGKFDKVSHTPTGKFKVVYMKKDPIYIDFTGKFIAGPYIQNKANVYGTRIIGLNYVRNGRHLCIHGTNEPELIPGYVSHMCVRLYNRDVEELFDHVHVGDTVEILP